MMAKTQIFLSERFGMVNLGVRGSSYVQCNISNKRTVTI